MYPSIKKIVTAAALAAAVGALLFACRTTNPSVRTAVTSDAAAKTYVAPGQYDEYYAFLSGGFSGQISVYGIP